MSFEEWITKKHWELKTTHVSDGAHFDKKSFENCMKRACVQELVDSDEMRPDIEEDEVEDCVKITSVKKFNRHWRTVPTYEINGQLEDNTDYDPLILKYNPLQVKNRARGIIDLTKFILRSEEGCTITNDNGEDQPIEITSYNLIRYNAHLSFDVAIRFAIRSRYYTSPPPSEPSDAGSIPDFYSEF